MIAIRVPVTGAETGLGLRSLRPRNLVPSGTGFRAFMGRVMVAPRDLSRACMLALALRCASSCTVAYADDAEVSAETTLQAYDVQAPGTTVVWARRRLTQTLGLRYVRTVEPKEPGRAAPASLGAHVQLRLNRDFGATCVIDDPTCLTVGDPARRGSYTPLADNGVVDLPLAYVEARDLPAHLSARAGRQLHYDIIGLARVDGLAARIEPHAALAFGAIGGVLVRRASIAGSDAFVPEGLARLALDVRERERAPYIEPPITSWLAGASVELGDERIARGVLAVRTTIERDDWIDRRIGAGVASRPVSPLRLSTHAIFDTIDSGLVDAEAGAELAIEPYRARLSVERHVPRFDPSSIWAFFDVAPLWIVGLGGTRQLTHAWSVSTTVRGRRTELRKAPEHDAGVEVATALASPRNTLALSGFGWVPASTDVPSEQARSGPLWGGSVSGTHRMTLALTIEAELSALRIDDPLRSATRGVSFFELLGAYVAVTEESSLQLALSHAHSGPIGQRLSFLAFLHVGAWR